MVQVEWVNDYKIRTISSNYGRSRQLSAKRAEEMGRQQHT